ncbi:replication endonuclease [Saccharospirillum alexandrii]|uniref:replication endonuclease n=1 Tax=Saccharospirillum alexandrii TaxID=2448477 RepID=UPI000FDAEB04|nr:replication endonuclease [Saccharospirillum alexandrii]
MDLNKQLAKIGTVQCRQWSKQIFERHLPISLYLKHAYIRKARQSGYKAANAQLREVDQVLRWADGSSVVFDQDRIKHLALLYSGDSKHLFDGTYKRTSDIRTSAFSVRTFVQSFGVKSSFDENWSRYSNEEMLAACKRAFDEKTWRRMLKEHSQRTVEGTLRKLGFVRKQSGVYISNYGASRVKAQRARNRTWIDTMVAINEEGIQVPLREAVDASISNPKVRHAELMARLRGYEEEAKEHDCGALFLTMTCPSSFHAILGESGRKNPKFEGHTPEDGMDYLNTTWAQIRADLKKKKIKIAGFRICEPHHDGTPHLHFLLYLPKPQTDDFRAIFIKHNLKQFGDEQGAEQYRCDIQELDLENGSPTGYIAKYIAKNIDGEDVGEDLEAGQEATTTADRVTAWASLWGIRQFQQIGSTPATVYREFRRLPKPLVGKHAEKAERARTASDNGDYAAFIKATGGMFVQRKHLTFRAFHIVKERLSSFGEEVKRLIGILSTEQSVVIQTRFHEWTLTPACMLITQEAAQPPPLEYWQ